MEQFLKALDDKIVDIITMLFFSGLGICIYLLNGQDSIKLKMRGAFLGFFISLSFSYPVYLFMGDGKWWVLAMVSSVLTISGQFLPDLITNAFRKYATKKASRLEED